MVTTRPTLGAPLVDAFADLPADAGDPGAEPDINALWALLFTSGTSAARRRCAAANAGSSPPAIG